MFPNIRWIGLHTYNRWRLLTTSKRIEGQKHPLLLWFCPANCHQQPHLSSWPPQQMICDDTGHHAMCNIDSYNGLSRWITLSQADCPRLRDATNATLIEIYDGSKKKTFKVHNYVFMESPKLTAIASDAADKMTNRRYKLLRRPSVPYKLSSVYPHTVAIKRDWIPNTVSIDRLTQSRTREQVTYTPQETMHTTRQAKGNRQRRKPIKYTKGATKIDTTVLQRNVVSRIMRQVDTTQERK